MRIRTTFASFAVLAAFVGLAACARRDASPASTASSAAAPCDGGGTGTGADGHDAASRAAEASDGRHAERVDQDCDGRAQRARRGEVRVRLRRRRRREASGPARLGRARRHPREHQAVVRDVPGHQVRLQPRVAQGEHRRLDLGLERHRLGQRLHGRQAHGAPLRAHRRHHRHLRRRWAHQGAAHLPGLRDGHAAARPEG